MVGIIDLFKAVIESLACKKEKRVDAEYEDFIQKIFQSYNPPFRIDTGEEMTLNLKGSGRDFNARRQQFVEYAKARPQNIVGTTYGWWFCDKSMVSETGEVAKIGETHEALDKSIHAFKYGLRGNVNPLMPIMRKEGDKPVPTKEEFAKMEADFSAGRYDYDSHVGGPIAFYCRYDGVVDLEPELGLISASRRTYLSGGIDISHILLELAEQIALHVVSIAPNPEDHKDFVEFIKTRDMSLYDAAKLGTYENTSYETPAGLVQEASPGVVLGTVANLVIQYQPNFAKRFGYEGDFRIGYGSTSELIWRSIICAKKPASDQGEMELFNHYSSLFEDLLRKKIDTTVK